MDHYTAHPIDDNWGEPETRQWDILTDKYGDTGQRYYAFHIKGDGWFTEGRAIISDGSVKYYMTLKAQDGLTMERGDKFPFSK